MLFEKNFVEQGIVLVWNAAPPPPSSRCSIKTPYVIIIIIIAIYLFIYSVVNILFFF